MPEPELDPGSADWHGRTRRPPPLVVCPLNKLTLDLRGVSTVWAGKRRPATKPASRHSAVHEFYSFAEVSAVLGAPRHYQRETLRT